MFSIMIKREHGYAYAVLVAQISHITGEVRKDILIVCIAKSCVTQSSFVQCQLM